MGILGDMFFGSGLILFDSFGSGGCSTGSSRRSVIANPPTYDLVREAIKHSDTEAGKFLSEVDAVKEDIQELCTNGFVEMVIKGNTNYKTSNEVKGEADTVINRVSKQYQAEVDKYNLCLAEFNSLVRELYEIKAQLIQDLKANSFPIFSAYKKADEIPSYKYQQSILSQICPPLEHKKGFDVQGKRKSANEYFDNAKEYEKNIQLEMEEIDNVMEFLNSVKSRLQEEKVMLYAVQHVIDELGSNIPVSREILQHVRVMTAEFIIDAEGKLNVKYVEALENVKRIFEKAMY